MTTTFGQPSELGRTTFGHPGDLDKTLSRTSLLHSDTTIDMNNVRRTPKLDRDLAKKARGAGLTENNG